MRPMGTGKRRISLAPTLANSPEAVTARALALEIVLVVALEPELVLVVAPLEQDPVAVKLARVRVEVVLELVLVVAPLEQNPVAVKLARVRVEVVLDLVQVAVELEVVPVAARLGLVPAVVVPVPGHPRARLAVPRGIKSEIAAHHRDLAHLVVGDLAAAAETTHEPAATEAAAAWAAAE
jgi:hypothetical protein